MNDSITITLVFAAVCRGWFRELTTSALFFLHGAGRQRFRRGIHSGACGFECPIERRIGIVCCNVRVTQRPEQHQAQPIGLDFLIELHGISKVVAADGWRIDRQTCL